MENEKCGTKQMSKIRNPYRIYSGNMKGRDQMRNQDVYGRIILKRMLKDWNAGV
jgi:hypothetical protein